MLLRLDTTVRAANVKSAKAQLTKHTRLRDEAQRELNRSQKLINAALLDEHEMELACIAFDTAEYQKARATLAQAESDLKDSEIRAPYDAIILQRSAEVGRTVVTQLQAMPLLVVAKDGRMVGAANVSTQRALSLKPNQHVTSKAGGQSFEGNILGIGLEAVAGKSTDAQNMVTVIFATQGGMLLPMPLVQRLATVS